MSRPYDSFRNSVEDYKYDAEEKIKLIPKSLNWVEFVNSQQSQGQKHTMHYFRGKIVLYYLIKKFNEGHMNKYMRAIALFVGFARGYLPMFGIESWNIFPGEDNQERVILFLLNFSLIYFYQYITRFVLQCIIDFRRRVFMFKALKGMVRPEKTSAKKYLPTMDIFDGVNAFSWYRIRRIARDYGFNMTKRNMLLIPTLFIYMIFIYILNWVKNLNWI